MGTNNRNAIATLVEQQQRYTILLRLHDRHGAELVQDRAIAAFSALLASLRRTLTWDQGTEMAHHKQITAATGMPVHLCEAHSPWQRGTNENTNGLARQYFPKGTDLSQHDADEIDRAEKQLNGRRRRRLGWASRRSSSPLLSSLSISKCCNHP